MRMPKRSSANMWPKVGAWAFVIGLVIAVVAALLGSTDSNTILVLGALGIVVGLLNVTDREVVEFLVATVAFMLAAQSLGNVLAAIPGVGVYLPAMLGNVVVVVAPAAAIVALRALYDVGRSA